jgi:hypothetical protein
MGIESVDAYPTLLPRLKPYLEAGEPLASALT